MIDIQAEAGAYLEAYEAHHAGKLSRLEYLRARKRFRDVRVLYAAEHGAQLFATPHRAEPAEVIDLATRKRIA